MLNAPKNITRHILFVVDVDHTLLYHTVPTLNLSKHPVHYFIHPKLTLPIFILPWYVLYYISLHYLIYDPLALSVLGPLR